jgi:transposase-like protein
MMNVLDEARAIMATLPQRESEPEQNEADTEKEHDVERDPEQPVRLADAAEAFPEPDEPETAEQARERQRREAVRMVMESGLSVRRAANETGLSPSAVQRALDAARRSGTGGTDGERVPGQSDDDAVLPPNFKSWAALARSYAAAQRKLHELAQQNAAIRSENDELREQLGEAVQLLAELKRAGVIR